MCLLMSQQKDVGEAENLGLAHVESFWKGPEGSTKSDNVPETRETSGRKQNQEQSKLMVRKPQLSEDNSVVHIVD